MTLSSEGSQVPRRVIVLAAGRGNQADGMAKCLIRHPLSRATVLDHLVAAFAGKRVTVVVGFRAIQVMDHYPQLDFVLNEHWADTGNAMSLALALDDEPTYVVPGDVFLDQSLVEEMDGAGPDLALISTRENRIPTAIHGVLDESGRVTGTYQGAVRDIAHPEMLGLFKMSTPQLLENWKRRSTRDGHRFAALTLPTDTADERVVAHPISTHQYDEVNTPADYLRLIRAGVGR